MSLIVKDLLFERQDSIAFFSCSISLEEKVPLALAKVLGSQAAMGMPSIFIRPHCSHTFGPAAYHYALGQAPAKTGRPAERL